MHVNEFGHMQKLNYAYTDICLCSVSEKLRGVVRFVDIGGILYLHCLNFLFTTQAGLFTYFC